MTDTFFEQIHTAAPDQPYIDTDRQNLTYTSHYHNEIELIPVIRGSVTVFCSAGTVTASAGDIAVLMPGEIHSFSTESGNHVWVIKIHCKNSASPADLSKYRVPGGIVRGGSAQCAALMHHIDSMVREYESDSIGRPFAVNAHANLIVAELLRSGLPVKQDSSARRRNEATLYLFNSVNGYIESHLTEAISLECIATHCNMSKYYFAHTFKSAMGVTFFEYLTSCRMNIALRLLKSTDENITSISHKSGFSNTRVFNRLFRARLGMSPGEYRKKAQR